MEKYGEEVCEWVAFAILAHINEKVRRNTSSPWNIDARNAHELVDVIEKSIRMDVAEGIEVDVLKRAKLFCNVYQITEPNHIQFMARIVRSQMSVKDATEAAVRG